MDKRQNMAKRVKGMSKDTYLETDTTYIAALARCRCDTGTPCLRRHGAIRHARRRASDRPARRPAPTSPQEFAELAHTAPLADVVLVR